MLSFRMHGSTGPPRSCAYLKTAILSAILCAGAARPGWCSTFTVNTTADSGAGSLRQAISDANTNAGADLIQFSIGTGLQTIKPLSTLPAVQDTVTIDGSSQPGFAGAPLIVIDGSLIKSGTGLAINADNCVVKSLVVNNGFEFGIVIKGTANHLVASGNVVEGCYVGTTPAGTAASQFPILDGIFLIGDGFTAGTGASNNLIGGTTTAARNIISGCSNVGVVINADHGDSPAATRLNTVEGNYIGTGKNGGLAVPNQEGVSLGSPDNIIGGTAPGARNVISGNTNNGIRMLSGLASSNTIQGNFIGTTASGNVALGNGTGINCSDDTGGGPSGNLFGGATFAAANVISGNNGHAIILDGLGLTGNVIQGNFIGSDRAGNAIPNHGVGILLLNGVENDVIGLDLSGQGRGNVIAFNTSEGILISDNNSPVGSSCCDTIRGNSIFSNGALGINLVSPKETNGVTLNDKLDADNGPNTLQNFPVIQTAGFVNGTTSLTGTIDTTPNTQIVVDLYGSAAADPSGYGEGALYLGAVTVLTDANGHAPFSFSVRNGFDGMFYSSTATASDGSTSEFAKTRQGVEVPIISPTAGSFFPSLSISISDATPGASIFFTTNSSTPTTSSTPYTGPFTINATTTVRARAFATGLLPNNGALAAFKLNANALTPVVAINAGGAAASPFVADVDFTGGATSSSVATVDTSLVANPAPQSVYQTTRSGSFSYSIPGLTPGVSYTVQLHLVEPTFTQPHQRVFNVSVNGAPALSGVDIVALTGGPNIAVVQEFSHAADSSGKLTINFSIVTSLPIVSGIDIFSNVPPTLPAPAFSPAGGTFAGSVSVAIADGVSDASIRFTTDGTTPTSTSTLYTGPITINSTTTLRARAFKPGFTQSTVASATYTIN